MTRNSFHIHKFFAELIGTFWLVFAGCGSAVLAARFPEVGIGLAGVALAFGLSVLTMAYAIGHISGCHLNPAVTVGLTAGGRFPVGQVLPYVVAQVLGAIVAAYLLFAIASGAPGFDLSQGFAANGFGDHSPGKYSLFSGFLSEVILTMMFLFIIMGATHGKAPVGFAGLAIGLGLTLIHLIGIPRHERLREPGTKHWACSRRGRMGYSATLALLAGPHSRRHSRRPPLQVCGR